MAYGFNEDRSKAYQVASSYRTVADMIADTGLKTGVIVLTAGFHESGDGGGAVYEILEAGAEEANGMDLIECSNGAIAKLCPGDYVTPEMFGAWGDGVHDDSNAFNRAFVKCVSIASDSNKKYKFASDFVFTAGSQLKLAGEIVTAGTLTINENVSLSTHKITYTGSNYCLVINSAANANIDIEYFVSGSGGMLTFVGSTEGANIRIDNADCEKECLYFNATDNSTKWVQYTAFSGYSWKSDITDCIYVSIDSSIGSGIAWFNANTFSRICLGTNTANKYGINFINRPSVTFTSENTLFGIDNTTLYSVSFERCRKGMHLVSVSGLRGYGLRCAETVNNVAECTVLSRDIILNFVDFISLLGDRIAVTNNITEAGAPVIINVPIYTKDQSFFREKPNYSGVMLNQKHQTPIYNRRRFYSDGTDYTAPSDFSKYAYNYFMLATYTVNLSDVYGPNDINDIYVFIDPQYQPTGTITFTKNGTTIGTITETGHYVFNTNGTRLLKA